MWLYNVTDIFEVDRVDKYELKIDGNSYRLK